MDHSLETARDAKAKQETAKRAHSDINKKLKETIAQLIEVKKCCSLKLNRYLNRYIYRDLMYNSRRLSIEAVSIKNYKIQISRFVFHAYPSYLCRVSFFTTLDIYKDYFRCRKR